MRRLALENENCAVVNSLSSGFVFVLFKNYFHFCVRNVKRIVNWNFKLWENFLFLFAIFLWFLAVEV